MADSLFEDNTDIDYLAELTKDGAKYDRSKFASDADLLKALAKGKYHADKTVEFQLSKNDQLTADFLEAKAASVAQAKFTDLLERMENRPQDQVNTQTGNHEQPLIDRTQIEEIATQRAIAAIEQREAQRKESENLAVVESRLRERFGDNARTILRDKMNYLGLDATDLKLLAKKSPEAVINALGLASQQQGYQNAPSSNMRSDSFKPNTEVRDAVYYEKLRKEKPTEYYSERTSVQRLKDMDHPDFLKRYEDQSQRTFY